MTGMTSLQAVLAGWSVALWLAVAPQALAAAPPPVIAAAVPGLGAAQLEAAFWIDRLQAPDEVLLDSAQIAAQNAALYARDASMHDLRALPATLPAAQVRSWITALAPPSTRVLYDGHGQRVSGSTLDALRAQCNLAALASDPPVRFGLIVRRADLRALPADGRMSSTVADADIDRLQETAEYPGTPVAIVHATADGQWLFVVTPRYAAWTRTQNVARGSRRQVLDYAVRTPYRVVTGAVVTTVASPEAPPLSQLALGMGTRVPELAVAPGTVVNGQAAYGAHAVLLPVRNADGTLALRAALIRASDDTTRGYLPLTARNVLAQAFKLLGERYGWGGDHGGRDCSSFVADVYRTMGVDMPRNTSRQADSPALATRRFDARVTASARSQALSRLVAGDLVFVPGHVMLALGQWHGQSWVINDVAGMTYRRGDGTLARVKLNAVAVTPLQLMRLDDGKTFVDHLTSIVRMRR